MGGKKSQTIGYWYRPAFHHGLCKGPIDEFLEFRGGSKKAWTGEWIWSTPLTESGTIYVNAANLWGGEKDQGGIEGYVDVMFGEATQMPNAYLISTFGPQTPAWRGICTVVFKGGRYGALNPYPHKASYKVRKIKAGWDGECWYEEKAEIASGALKMMNAAHVLVFSHTNSDMGRQPIESINEASLEAAADALYEEGFGICTSRNPARESVEAFQQRICRLIDGSFSRSVIDGQWYLDLARGDYDIEELPILTDDDILDFAEVPTSLDNAINSASVRYFDPQTKQTVVTPSARVMALVRQFGEIHQTYDFPEIATADLALRVAQRQVLATTTPTRAFDLVTNRVPVAWRQNTYFRLQAPKRGIADMVCIVGEKHSGTLKSGAIKFKAVQDIYSLPSTVYIEIEPGVDLAPIQTPEPIILQRAFESPYIDVVTALPRAELLALPEDVGHLAAVAVDPAESVDFTLMVKPDGGEYEQTAHGDWCPSATVVEAALCTNPINLTLTNAYRLDEVRVGMPALWDNEICRVDEIDAEALTITLGRACADTTPHHHNPGSRLWFWQGNEAADPTEYTDGETIEAKLLTNTGSQRLPLEEADELSVTFAQRWFRPYPPADLQINGESCPTSLEEREVTVTWAHRHRVLQEDQLIDTSAEDIGPEDGTTYSVSYIDVGTSSILESHAALTDPTDTFEFPPEVEIGRVEVRAHRDGQPSWQANSHEFSFAPSGPPYIIDGAYLYNEPGEFNWPRPAGMTKLVVTLIAGGAGGQDGATSSSSVSVTARGGTRAGMVRTFIYDAINANSLPDNVPIVVGLGGVNAANFNNTGGTSSKFNVGVSELVAYSGHQTPTSGGEPIYPYVPSGGSGGGYAVFSGNPINPNPGLSGGTFGDADGGDGGAVEEDGADGELTGRVHSGMPSGVEQLGAEDALMTRGGGGGGGQPSNGGTAGGGGKGGYPGGGGGSGGSAKSSGTAGLGGLGAPGAVIIRPYF